MIPRRFSRLSIVGAAVALVLALSYALFQARGIMRGPAIEVHAPASGSTVEALLLTVSGRASAAVGLALNDRPIFTTQTGEFSEELLLAKGYNVIVIKARDRFGRTTEESIEIIYE